MKTLSLTQAQQVAGGFNCFGYETWQKAESKAVAEAKNFALYGDIFLMAGTYSIATKIAGAGFAPALGAAAAVGLVATPYLAILAYRSSTAWNMLKTTDNA